MSEREGVSERVRASIAAARRRSIVVRLTAALAVVGLTGSALIYGYSAAALVLPPVSHGGAASLMWLPLLVSAGLIVLTAGVLLTAIARWR